MRSEWPSVRLGELCLKIGSGVTPRGGSNIYVGDGVRFIRSQNVYDLRFEFTGLAHLDGVTANKLQNVTVQPSDVLLNITGDSVARACLAPDDEYEARVSQHVAIVRPNILRVDAHFLVYWLVSQRVKSRLLALASAGATRKALTKTMLETLEVPLPPVDEQRRIASVLNTITDKIDSNRRVATLLENSVATLFLAGFTDFIGVRAFEETIIGQVPAGWKAGEIADIASPHRQFVKGENALPYIGLDAMPRGSTVLDQWETEGAPRGQAATFAEGDILFGKLRPYFRKVGVAPIAGRCSTEILVLRPHDPDLYGVLLGHVASQAFIDHCTTVSRGTRMPRAEWVDAGAFKIAVPPPWVARKFSALTRSIYTQVRGLTHESRTLRELRDTLLPKLISGEIRIPDTEDPGEVIGLAAEKLTAATR